MKDYLNEGVYPGSRLLKEIRLDDSAFSRFYYFDEDDFSIQFINDGKDGLYIIKVKATEGGGTSFDGPAGTGSYNSQIGQFTGMLK